MRIAIAHWQGRVSPVFDVSNRLFLIEIENGREQGRKSINLSACNPFERAKEVSNLAPDVLLCGAVSHDLETALVGLGVEVVGFLCGGLEEVIEAFIHGQLFEVRYQTPGYRRKRQSFRPV